MGPPLVRLWLPCGLMPCLATAGGWWRRCGGWRWRDAGSQGTCALWLPRATTACGRRCRCCCPKVAGNPTYDAVVGVAAAGCESTLEALVGLGVCEEHGAAELARAWYAAAATKGNLGALLRKGVLVAAVREGAPLCALQWLMGQGALVVEAGVRDSRGCWGRMPEYNRSPREQEQQEMEVWLLGLVEVWSHPPVFSSMGKS